MNNRLKRGSLLVVVFTFILSLGVNGQGIEFFKGSFEEAKLLASKENKPLFVDVYTSWCGPCKKLSKTVFTQKNVGDYFNEEFICFKLQADKKGSGNRKIANQYKVNSYPTLLWLNGDGEILHVSIGFKESESLIQEAKLVFDEDRRIGGIIEKWNNGDRTLPVASKYFAFDRNVNGEFDTYFNGLSEEQKLSKDVFNMIGEIRLNIDSKLFEYLVKHRADYQKLVEPWDIRRVIDNNIEEHIISNYKSDNYNTLLEKYRNLNIEQVDLYAKKAEWKHYIKNRELEQFEKSTKEYINAYKNQRPNVYFELINSLYELPKEDLNNFKNREIAIDWALLAVKNSNYKIGNGIILVQAYIVAGNIEKAKQVSEKYLKELEADKSEQANYFKEYILEILKEIK